MADSKADSYFKNDCETDFAAQVRLNQQDQIFDARFKRCYRTLHLIACRVLGGPERAEEAIASCWRKASRHPQQFEHEGEFHSWLLRVLIDEALVLLRECVSTPSPQVWCEPVTVPVFASKYVFEDRGNVRTDDQGRFLQDSSVALGKWDKSVISKERAISNERNRET